MSKIVAVVLMPLAVSVVLTLLGVLLKRRALCVLGLAVIVLGGNPWVASLAMRATEGWQDPVPVPSMPRACAIVVLSGMLTDSPGQAARPEWSDAVDRFEGGVELFLAGKAPWLVFTAGIQAGRPSARPEGDELAARAVRHGVPRANIVVTDRASNTEEEAAAFARAVQARIPGCAHQPVILVTSAFHMRRSRLLFTWRGVNVVPYPVDFQVVTEKPFSVLDLFPSAGSLSSTEKALHEWYGYAYYIFLRHKDP